MKVIIIGGGASGILCAIKLKQLNKNIEVVILEQNERCLNKVLKTGNGKCNILNKNIKEDFYNDFSLIEKHMKNINVYQELTDLGLFLKEMSEGRVYPYSESATTVTSLLMKKVSEYNIKVINNHLVKEIIKKDNKYIVDGLICDFVVIATGSNAMAKTNGLDLVNKLNIKYINPTPGLVPFETYEKTAHLNGLRVKCNLTINNKTLNGEILFKNNGLSGVLALDASRYIKENDIVSLDLMPEYSLADLKNINSENIYGILTKMIALDVINRNQDIAYTLKNYTFTVKKKLDFNNAQIALGGVNLNEVNQFFESKKNPNLYIVGELLDVDGASGGYNLYFAFLSGIVCGINIIEKIEKSKLVI